MTVLAVAAQQPAHPLEPVRKTVLGLSRGAPLITLGDDDTGGPAVLRRTCCTALPAASSDNRVACAGVTPSRTLVSMVTANHDLVREIRAALAAAADQHKAAPMQAYMKSAMPFLGVQKPARVAVLQPLLRRHPLPNRDVWERTTRTLWDDAAYREHRYSALELARHRPYLSWATDLRSLDLYDHLIVTGAWWDYVDEVATRLLGPLRRKHPGETDEVIRRWSRDPDRWRRRAAVICQVGARESTDLGLLTACVLDNAADTDFFLRKAIGWALRDYAKTDPGWVRAFATAYQSRLSPLSIREATRNLHRM